MKAKKKAKKKVTTAARKRGSLQAQSLEPVTASIHEKVWIYYNDEERRFRVFPSPKAVNVGDKIHFGNLTQYEATVTAKGILDPDTLTVPTGGKPVGAKAVGGANQKYAYQVVMANGQPAHGNSDPDIIIDP